MPNTENNELLDVVDLTTSDRHSLSTSSMPSTKHSYPIQKILKSTS